MSRLVQLFRHLTVPLIVAAVLVGAALAVSLVATESESQPGLRLLAQGAMTLSSSRDAEAILSVSDLVPGESTSGTVRVGNTGDLPGSLRFSTEDLIDSPGPGGGLLSSALDLRVSEVSSGSEHLVYSGPLDVVSALEFETLPAGAERTYRLTVRLPDTGVPEADDLGDNLLQGAATSVSFDWALGSDAMGECGSILRGGPDDDRIRGTRFADEIDSEAGGDRIVGRAGDDCMAAGPGKDRVRGNNGADILFGGPGRDVLLGGRGSDTFRSNGDGIDYIHCGSGRDRVRAGPRDRTFGC